VTHARLLLILLLFLTSAGPASGDVAVAWNGSEVGRTRVLESASPFDWKTSPVSGGRDVTLRLALGRLWALSRADGTLREIDPPTGAPLREWNLGAGSEPLDVAVVSPELAWVTLATSGVVQRLDPATGIVTAGPDLSDLADPDGNPDLGTMALHEGRLFVQVRRRHDFDFQFVRPAQIAVLDATTGERIDVDPVVPGTQTIELRGTAPKLKMQIVESTRSLWVSATGADFDDGGLERVDLDSYETELVLREADGATGSDLGAFVFTSSDEGFLTFTTDLTLSSHLLHFDLVRGVTGSELNVVVEYFVPALVHDPQTNTLYFPRGGSGKTGVEVHDATSGALLSAANLTDGSSTDLVLTCEGRCERIPVFPEPWLGIALAALATSLAAAAVRRPRRRSRGWSER